jgi:hypothetical protein
MTRYGSPPQVSENFTNGVNMARPGLLINLQLLVSKHFLNNGIIYAFIHYSRLLPEGKFQIDIEQAFLSLQQQNRWFFQCMNDCFFWELQL